MIILATLGLIQVCFLPGWLALRVAGIPRHPGQSLVTLALSLLINYQLVLALTAAGLYGRAAVFVIFLLELGLAASLAARARPLRSLESRRIPVNLQPPVRDYLSPADARFSESPAVRGGMLAIAWMCVAWYCLLWMQKQPGVFGVGDDLLSWHRWAVDWYNGRLPVLSGYYPQLLPANWSLLHHFTGTSDLHVFARAMMGLFPVGLLLLPLALHAATGSVAALGAVPLLAIAQQRLLGTYIFEGYMDVALAFFFTAVAVAFVLGRTGAVTRVHAAWLATLIACAAALTKQGGLYVLAVVFLAHAWIAWHRGAREKGSWRQLAAHAVCACILVAPWYIYKSQVLRAGADRSEWEYQTQQLHGGRSYKERLERAVVAISAKFFDTKRSAALGVIVASVLALLSLAALAHPLGRGAVIAGIPYALLWALLFSYDHRNIAAALPFLAFISSIGAFEILGRTRSVYIATATELDRRSLGTIAHRVCGAAALLGSVAALQLRWTDSRLRETHVQQMRRIGYPQVNAALLDLLHRGELRGPIITDYQQLAHVPELGPYYRAVYLRVPETLPALLRATDGGYRGALGWYVLLHEEADREVEEFVRKTCTLRFRQRPFTLFELPARLEPGAPSPL